MGPSDRPLRGHRAPSLIFLGTTPRSGRRTIRPNPKFASRIAASLVGCPEQVLDPVELDPRSDVYALAGTIYNVTTGRAFFDEYTNPRDRFIAHMQHDPFEQSDRIRTYPTAIAKLLRAATERDPRDRPTPLEFGREFAIALWCAQHRQATSYGRASVPGPDATYRFIANCRPIATRCRTGGFETRPYRR